MNARTISLSALALLATLSIAAPSARADQSCVTPLQNRTAQTPRGYGWTAEMSIHREDATSVTYARAFLTPDGAGGFASGAWALLFSERLAPTIPSQPFDAARYDSIYLNLSSAGLLRIRDVTTRIDTYWDMACQGPVLTKYFPGYGVITFTFRQLQNIIY